MASQRARAEVAKGYPCDYVDAVMAAADKGDLQSMLDAGYMMRTCAGLESTPEQAFAMFKRAADLMSPPALSQLGQFYLVGFGVEKDGARRSTARPGSG